MIKSRAESPNMGFSTMRLGTKLMAGFRTKFHLLHAAGLVLALASGTAAADGHSYAVLSIVSDRVTLVGYNSATGSHLSHNKLEERALPSKVFDRTVIGSLRVAIEKMEPSSQTIIIPPTDDHLYQLQDDIEDPTKLIEAIVRPLQDGLKRQGVDQLILVTKERASARVMSDREMLSNAGTLYGLGFYVDDVMSMQTDDAHAVGFVAPYLYVRVRRIDVNSLAVLREQIITVCQVAAIPARANATTAWDSLSESQKVQALGGMVRTQMTNAVPQLLASETVAPQ